MFFERVGRFATRFRVPIIITWIALAAIVTVVAPNINDVASSDTADFLPSGAPFEHAGDVYKATFPEDDSKASSVIVMDARDLPGGIFDATAATFDEATQTGPGNFTRDLAAWLRGPDAPDAVLSVTAPTDSQTIASLMVASTTSGDPALANQIAFVRVEFAYTPTEPPTETAINAIESWITAHRPAGLKTYQTGSAPIVLDTTNAVKTSAERTIWVTIVLVVLMLLAVYRSPVSPLIPLSAVTVAYLITRGIVAFLGAHYMTITSYANVLLVAVMYGAGTDYCLFLISRYREEMAEHVGLVAATAHTVHRVGETISSSAGTIFVGFMAMSFAQMGIFKTSGPALAIGVVVSLLAGLTFVPAVLSTLGDRAFWPFKATHRHNGRLYELTSKWVSTRPLTVILVIVVLMIPLSLYGVTRSVNYDMLTDLPDSMDTVVGFNLLKDSLGAGSAIPLTVVVTGRDPSTVAADIVQISDQIGALRGVYDVRGLDDPLGLHSTQYADLLHVGAQLRLAAGMFQDTQATASADPAALGSMLAGFRDYLDTLATTFPSIADDPNLLTLHDLLDNPLRLVTQRDAAIAALDGLATEFDAMPDALLLPTALGDALGALGDSNPLGSLIDRYMANSGTAFKLDVVFGEYPSSNEGMDTLTAIRAILKPYHTASGDGVASGMAAVTTDLRDTMDSDLLHAIGFVLAGIFIVLLIMLRSIVAPLYLIGTVLLSFTFTLGLTNLVFETVMHINGLTWYVPFFSFVFLVALGIDYSIFLFGRVKEEVSYNGMREGVHIAVATTGAIITSAGMILSGTFAALMAGQIAGLRELGFAVGVGVLIDTFIVRTVLDPALATLFGRWTWWPGGVPKATGPRRETQPAPSAGD